MRVLKDLWSEQHSHSAQRKCVWTYWRGWYTLSGCLSRVRIQGEDFRATLCCDWLACIWQAAHSPCPCPAHATCHSPEFNALQSPSAWPALGGLRGGGGGTTWRQRQHADDDALWLMIGGETHYSPPTPTSTPYPLKYYVTLSHSLSLSVTHSHSAPCAVWHIDSSCLH